MKFPPAKVFLPIFLIPILVTLALLTKGNSIFATTTWDPGDVFVAVSNGTYQVYTHAGVLKDTVQYGTTTTIGCSLDTSGNLYGAFPDLVRITKFAASLPHAPSVFSAAFGSPKSIAFTPNGNAYVADSVSGIIELDSAGNYIRQVTADVANWLDIAQDNDTIYYTQGGNDIKRVSISTGVMPNFVTGTATSANALGVLTDGSVIVATNNEVKRFDSLGNQVMTYDLPGVNTWVGLSLTPYITSFWAGDTLNSQFVRFNIATGLVEAGTFATGTAALTLNGMCTKDGSVAPEPSPSPSPSPLVGPPTSKDQCKEDGWQTFNNPTFKNQGDCVSYAEKSFDKD